MEKETIYTKQDVKQTLLASNKRWRESSLLQEFYLRFDELKQAFNSESHGIVEYNAFSDNRGAIVFVIRDTSCIAEFGTDGIAQLAEQKIFIAGSERLLQRTFSGKRIPHFKYYSEICLLDLLPLNPLRLEVHTLEGVYGGEWHQLYFSDEKMALALPFTAQKIEIDCGQNKLILTDSGERKTGPDRYTDYTDRIVYDLNTFEVLEHSGPYSFRSIEEDKIKRVNYYAKRKDQAQSGGTTS